MALSRQHKIPEIEKDWEDEYRRLYAKHNELKLICNQQEEQIKLLEVARRKNNAGALKPRDREEEDLIASLYEQINKFKASNTALSDKNKALVEQLEKIKKELTSVKGSLKRAGVAAAAAPVRQVPNERDVEIVPGRTNRKIGGGSVAISVPLEPQVQATTGGTDNFLEVARKYKARLSSAEEQLASLRDENARLRASAGNTNDRSIPAPPASTKMSRSIDAAPVPASDKSKDLAWRLEQLQSQYDHLSARSTAQGQAYKQSEAKLEENSQKVRELRRALEDLRHEKEISDSKSSRASELEELVTELKRENRNLEDKIAKLCETPFIRDAFGQQEMRARFEDAEREKEEYRTKINHLQEAVRTHFSALTSLKQQAASLREEREEAVRKMEEMKIRQQELETGSNLLKDKLQLYSGDDGVDIESLERALTLVKRRSGALERLPFLENPEGENLVTVPGMKRKLEEVQLMNLKLTQEAERLESMLKLQSEINKDLHKELDSVVHKADKDKREILQRANDFEEIALKRLDKIQKLEAQLREFVYGVTKKGKKGSALKGSLTVRGLAEIPEDSSTVYSEDNALLTELMDEKGGDILPDENLLEVWIKGATIVDGVVAPGTSTFVVIDFFDYESQATTLESGSKPLWDFAATFKVNVDDFLLRYFATDVINLELNMASQGDFSLLARCALPLSGLLRAKPSGKFSHQPMLSVNTGEILAHITVECKLALPISELYRLFLERHPNEKGHIEDISMRRALEAAGDVEHAKQIGALTVTASQTAEDEVRLYNELEITIIQAAGLPKNADGSSPTSYVHFQLLGNPDKFTDPVPDSSDPVYNQKFVFPMVTNDQQLRLMQRSKLHLTVVDLKAQETDDPNNGLVGEVFIPLTSLADSSGGSGVETYIIRSTKDEKVADIQLLMKWKNPLRRQRELGPNALSGVDVESLISSFGAGPDKEGVVDYRAFCRFADPPGDVVRTVELLKAFVLRVSYKESQHPKDVLKIMLADKKSQSEIISKSAFMENVLKTQIDALPSELGKLFHFIDTDEDDSITIDQAALVLSLDDVATVRPALQEKIRTRAKELRSRELSMLRAFERANQWGPDGMVTRLEFKAVLKQLGFNLADEPEPVPSTAGASSRFGAATKARLAAKNLKVETQTVDRDVLNDTAGSDDVLFPHGESENSGGGVAGNARAQRQEFAERVSDAHAHSASVLTAAAEKKAAAVVGPRAVAGENKGSSEAAPMTSVGINILDTSRQKSQKPAADPYGDGLHHETVQAHPGNLPDDKQGDLNGEKKPKKGSAAVKERSVDAVASADGLQEKDRDGRRRDIEAHSSRPPRDSSSRGVSADHTNRDPIADLLAAEASIKQGIKAIEGSQPFPDLLKGFQTVDTNATNFVNRTQFAYVIQQFKMIKLYGVELRACMDFFDVSGDGTKIDYGAFVRLVRHQDPPLLPTLQKLYGMAFNHRSILKFRRFDAAGMGSIKRSDMLQALNESGHGQLSPAVALSLLKFFETKVDGDVNYGNFLEYALENGVSAEASFVAKRLYSLIGGVNDSSSSYMSANMDDEAIKRLFSKIDVERSGNISPAALHAFVNGVGIASSKQAAVALVAAMDLEGNGDVSIHDFIRWARAFPTSSRETAAMYNILSIAEIQKKAHTFMFAVAASGEVSLEQISQVYQVYDWKRPPSGTLDSQCFQSATFKAGFPFTSAELRILAAEFPDGAGKVSYKRFLTWATATPEISATRISQAVRSAGTIIKFLQATLQRGVDLLSIFRRYDSLKTGRITSNEFAAALSDLGLSSISNREALELADRFKATAADFILYQRVVAELLRGAEEASGAADVDIVDVVVSALQRSKVTLRRLRDVFEHYDRTDSGRVREEDLGTIFEEAGSIPVPGAAPASSLRLRGTDVIAIANRFPAGSKGWVLYPALLNVLESRGGERLSGSVRALGASSRHKNMPAELPAKLRDFFESLIIRGKDFRAEFDKFDGSFSTSISHSDFRDVMQERLRAQLSSRELEAIEAAYRSAKDPRKIDHVKFIHELHPRFFGTEFADEASEEMQVLTLAESLRSKVRRKCDYTTPGELKRPFLHFARGSSKESVTLDDFSVAIRDLGMRIPGDRERALFNMIDISGRKEFQYVDFVVFVCDPLHQDVSWKLKRLIARANISEREITNALHDQDSNDSGYLLIAQFKKALASCNLELSDSDIQRLALRFDKEESQRVNIKRFLRFLGGKGSSEQNVDLDTSKKPPRQFTEDSETFAWKKLRKTILDKLKAGYTSSEVFSFFDSKENQGTVDLMSLQLGARDLGSPLTREESRSILRRMTLFVGGPISGRLAFFESLGVDEPDSLSSTSHARGSRQSGSEFDDARPSRQRDRRDVGLDDDDGYDEEELTERRRRRRKLQEREIEKNLSVELIELRERIEDAVASRRPRRSLGGEADQLLPRDRPAHETLLALDACGIARPGFVTQKELVRSMESLDVSVASRTLIRIFDFLDPDITTRVRNSTLVEKIFPGTDSTRFKTLVPEDLSGTRSRSRDIIEEEPRRARSRDIIEEPGARSRDSERARDIAAMFRRRSDLRDEVTVSMKKASRDSSERELLDDLLAACKRSDEQGSGLVSARDFARALELCGIRFPDGVERDLLDSLREVSGSREKVAYDAFVTSLRGEQEADSQADDVLERLRKRISRDLKQGADMGKVFGRFDKDGDGELTVDEFEAALEDLGIPLTRKEAQRVLAKFSRNGSFVKFRDFVKAFSPNNPQGSNGVVEVIIDRIRDVMESRYASATNGARKMKEIFADMDINGDGELSASEFKSALSTLKLDLTRDETEDLLSHFDKRGRGSLNYKDFIGLVGYPKSLDALSIPEEKNYSSPGGSPVSLALDRVRQAMESRYGTVAACTRKLRDGFVDADSQDRGSLSAMDFKNVLQRLKVDLSRSEEGELVRHFEGRNGLVDYRGFIDVLYEPETKSENESKKF